MIIARFSPATHEVEIAADQVGWQHLANSLAAGCADIALDIVNDPAPYAVRARWIRVLVEEAPRVRFAPCASEVLEIRGSAAALKRLAEMFYTMCQAAVGSHYHMDVIAVPDLWDSDALELVCRRL